VGAPGPVERIVAGRYRLIRALGSGGMGTVWLAEDQLLGRQVAVKEVSLPLDVTENERTVLRERTLREARTAARLNHPNVVTIYDVVQDAGRPWIVMELVAARSLRDIVAEDGPMSPRRAAGIGRQVLTALDAAHALGIMHRDVKPGNVLIDADDRAVLADFGIARTQDSPTLTTSGVLVGSPSYIAPERARGERGGPEADLWSLGATLYAAVEGRPPYDRPGALATLTAVVTGEPDPPRRCGALWPVIRGLLTQDPAQRLRPAAAARMLREVAEGDAAAERTAPQPDPGTAPLPELSSTPEVSSTPAPARSWGTARSGAPQGEPSPSGTALQHAERTLAIHPRAAVAPEGALAAAEAAPAAAPVTPAPADIPEPEPSPQPELEPVPESHPQPDAVPEPKAAPHSEPVPQPEAVPESYPEPEPVPQPEAVPESYPEPEPLPEPDAVPEPAAAPEPHPEPEPEPGPAPEPEPAGEPAAVPAPAPERGPSAEPERVPDPLAAPAPAPVPGPLPVPGRPPVPDPASDPGPTHIPGPTPIAEPGPGPGPTSRTRPWSRPWPRRWISRAGLAAALVLAAAGLVALVTSLSQHKAQALAPSHASSRPGAPATAAGGSGAGSRGSPSATATAGSPSPSTAGSSAAAPGGAVGTAAPIPAGWRRYQDATGFSIAMPNDWRVSHQGHYVYITPPSGAEFLLIDQSSHPQPNPLADWQQQEANRESSYAGYHRIRLVAVRYPQAEKAADWEFTYYSRSVLTHVLNRNVLANATHAYALYWSTPQVDWNSNWHIFQNFARTFQPAS
jgi:eukaryotic-like serine/threonine-protein kinase